MISLSDLSDHLLDALRTTELGSIQYQTITHLLKQLSHVEDSLQLVYSVEYQLGEQRKVQDRVLGTFIEKVKSSLLWNVWAYYPLEHVEGPYQEQNVAMERAQVLQQQTLRAHVVAIVGSERERKYRAVVASRNAAVTE